MVGQNDRTILSLSVRGGLAGLQHVTVTPTRLVIDLFVEVILSLIMMILSVACIVLRLVSLIDQTLYQNAVFLIRVVQSTVRLVWIVIVLL